MIWGGKWEWGSGLGTHVHPWLIHVNVWQNQYIIVKQNKVKIKIKKKKKEKDKYHMVSLAWTLKYDTNELIYETETDSQT